MATTAPRIAIVHDWLYGGGAEQVVLELHHLYPDAPIYTSYCSDEWRQKLGGKVITGYLQNWPFNKLRKFLPLLRQRWFAGLDLSDFDVVISSSGNGEAKFVRAKKHICYCHAPTHFYWSKYDEYLANPGFRPKWLVRLGLKMLVKPLRKRDYAAAQKVDAFIANSTHTRAAIKTYYNRDSDVIFPPVDTERFAASKRQSSQATSFIMWGRHVPYKRFDIAVEACTNLKLPLTVIGSGPATDSLKQLAGPTINFTNWLSDSEFTDHITRASAFIFPSEEDFGIAPVEALAAGLPVIAYKAGGALDYITPDETGVFFSEQTTDSLVQTLQAFDPSKYSAHDIKNKAKQFSIENFHKNLSSYIKNALQ